MDIFKEFESASLDEAIKEACSFYDAPREKLEIEIVHDAKKGVFGIVGARKACIKARRVAARASLATMAPEPVTALRTEAEPVTTLRTEAEPVTTLRTEAEPVARAERGRGTKKATKETGVASEASELAGNAETAHREPAQKASTKPVGHAKQDHGRAHKARDERAKPAHKPSAQPPMQAAFDADFDGDMQPPNVDNGYDGPTMFEDAASVVALQERRNKPTPKPNPRPKPTRDADAPMDDGAFDGLNTVDFDQLDHELLLETTRIVADKLILPIAEDASIEVQIAKARVDVHIDCGDAAGIMIGREGQTLAALQYLVARLVSRLMGAAIRVQLDIGDYRQRQDERLQTLALSIAERVRQNGKAYSTRPMSSYHRRIVHVALQNEVDLQTRSYGDGALKRVIIYKKRPENS